MQIEGIAYDSRPIRPCFRYNQLSGSADVYNFCISAQLNAGCLPNSSQCILVVKNVRRQAPI